MKGDILLKILISEKLSPHKYKTPEGYLICVDSVFARTGKQTYRRREVFGDACEDGDMEVEVDRPYDEVFSQKTLASFENKPICVEHPNEDVNCENYKHYSVGFCRDIHKGNIDGEPVMLGTLVFTNVDAIADVESGKYTELSCGYDCDIVDSETPYQRNIRGNHVAICEQGRAGIARIVDSLNIVDGTHLIKGIVFESKKNLTNERFRDLYDSGIAKLDNNVYIKWWDNWQNHISVINSLGVDKYMTFSADEVNGNVHVDFGGDTSTFGRYMNEIRIKANKFFKGKDSIRDMYKKFAVNKAGKQFVIEERDGRVIVRNEFGNEKEFKSIKEAEETLRKHGLTILDEETPSEETTKKLEKNEAHFAKGIDTKKALRALDIIKKIKKM